LWADNQNTEFSNLQATLTQYIEAYNAVTAELAQLQSAQPATPAAENVNNGQKDEEIAKLKAAVRAKGIEIEDLVKSILFNSVVNCTPFLLFLTMTNFSLGCLTDISSKTLTHLHIHLSERCLL
jgi:hypothetical protein